MVDGTVIRAAAAVWVFALSAHAIAQHAGHGTTGATAAPAAKAAAPASKAVSATSQGEVRKVDKVAGKVTLKHGEIRNLEMPAMTMVFTVADPSMLERLKPGDKVRFVADKQGDNLIVRSIEPVQ